MNCPEVEEHLDTYLDDALDPRARAVLERHLADCARCRRDLEFLKGLRAEAAALPRSIEPERDLWPEVAGRLTAGARGRGLTLASPGARRALLAAAAVGLVAASSAVTALVLRDDRGAPSSLASPSLPVPPVLTAAHRLEAQYATAVAELEALLGEGRGSLDPKTVAALEESLRAVDRAIQEARLALVADPGSQSLARRLASSYAAKIDLLRRATRLTSGS